jgi:hypothetical protein
MRTREIGGNVRLLKPDGIRRPVSAGKKKKLFPMKTENPLDSDQPCHGRRLHSKCLLRDGNITPTGDEGVEPFRRLRSLISAVDNRCPRGPSKVNC